MASEVNPVEGHKAESERLGRLTEFLQAFAPSIGQSVQTGREADHPAGSRVVKARNAAIAAAFKAVERIAVESFNFKKAVPDESQRSTDPAPGPSGERSVAGWTETGGPINDPGDGGSEG